jgi:serine/threonine protein kinase
MHRDIKPANILIMGESSEEYGRVKIGSFLFIFLFSFVTPLVTDWIVAWNGIHFSHS